MPISGGRRRRERCRTRPSRVRRCSTRGRWSIAGIAAGSSRRLGQAHLPDPGGRDLVSAWIRLQRPRPTTAWVLAPPTFVVGGYWYVRAMIKTGGNPIPTIGFGPLHLPRPDQMPLDPRPRFAVAHYLGEPTLQVVLPPARQRLRAALAAGPDCRRGGCRLHRLALAQHHPARNCGGGARHGLRLRLHPADRGGQGLATGFFTNTRYRAWCWRWFCCRWRPLRGPDRRAWLTLLFLTAVYVITVLTTPRWYPGFIIGTIFLTLAVLRHRPGSGMARSRRVMSRAAVVGAGAAVALVAVALGRAQEVQYYKHHYTHPTWSFSRTVRSKKLLNSRISSRTSGSGLPARRDLLRPVRLLHRRQPQ